MKKLIFGTILLALIIAVPIPTMAGVDIGINISLPPPIGFAGPPEMVVLPETYIYVVPDSDVDIFFYGGWWWRPWNGRWYRSHYYNSGWGYYQGVPSFYSEIPSGWRNDYREHRWGGHQWNYQRIPQQQVQQNWRGWEKNKHWEKQNTWGVQDLKPRTRTQQPSQAVQPKSQQVRSQVREVAKPQQSRQQSREIKPQQSREIQQKQPRSQQVREAVKPQQSRQQSREVRSQQPRPQQVRKETKPQQSKSQKGKPGREKEEEQNRR